jgi:DNA-binding response OmpR family regulator
MVSMMLEDMLADLGCQVVGPAPSLAAGLALADINGVDGAVLDVNLAGEKAFPIADALAAKGVPFIYATGYGRAGLRDEDAERPVVQKPYSTADLARTLRAVGVID